MKMTLLTLRLVDFKGERDATYHFKDTTKIIAENGVGKSTIADAFYWVMADKDYRLISNPNIRPNDGRECTPTVEMEIDIDGKPITISKAQKMKKSKPDKDGNVKVALTNTYSVNGVEKSERDFKAYLENLGFDFKLFLPLSHPDVFLQGMNEKKQKQAIRDILFSMSNNLSDIDIAKETQGITDVAALLENYTVEEIEAMQKTTQKKIAENYGKNGEILRARIEGLEQAKTDIDVAELELARNGLKEQIADAEGKISSMEKRLEGYTKVNDEILRLEFKKTDLVSQESANIRSKKAGLQAAMNQHEMLISETNAKIARDRERMTQVKTNLTETEKEIEKLRNDYQTQQNANFDNSSLICPYCGQEYPEERKAEIRADFDATKKNRIDAVISSGNALKKQIEEMNASLKEMEALQATREHDVQSWENTLSDLSNEMSALPDTVDLTGQEEYEAIQKEIDEKKKALEEQSDVDNAGKHLKLHLAELKRQLNAVDQQFVLVDNNLMIDDHIEELQDKQVEYEQAKADTEKIMDQLSLLSKRKNELLERDVNSHFEIINFRLFTFQKNGGYLDDCTPLIDGKDFNNESNGALKVLAKLDIIFGLQRFYRQSYPVFVDDFSLITGNTESRIKPVCQLIELIARDGIKKLKVE